LQFKRKKRCLRCCGNGTFTHRQLLWRTVLLNLIFKKYLGNCNLASKAKAISERSGINTNPLRYARLSQRCSFVWRLIYIHIYIRINCHTNPIAVLRHPMRTNAWVRWSWLQLIN